MSCNHLDHPPLVRFKLVTNNSRVHKDRLCLALEEIRCGGCAVQFRVAHGYSVVPRSGATIVVPLAAWGDPGRNAIRTGIEKEGGWPPLAPGSPAVDDD
jgi:hypothetical protein